jgi:hypothetical protein
MCGSFVTIFKCAIASATGKSPVTSHVTEVADDHKRKVEKRRRIGERVINTRERGRRSYIGRMRSKRECKQGM